MHSPNKHENQLVIIVLYVSCTVQKIAGNGQEGSGILMLIVPDSEHEWRGSERRTVSARGATAAVMSRRDAGHQARVMGAARRAV